ncbi:MerR family transcriptional regulator [Umezawaea endophytica]|uniref:MerR family transcriptional regulator n=1 Tax=Umezawaea endophytica TaxID=1654476 RepID=A0A9X3ADY9_9PSEU|nr:MerR family transcriptional regulator [Umezawaea endophytica]MCS7475365.1 MerR family transcriptional regulator [Umezawaea endophytica]
MTVVEGAEPKGAPRALWTPRALAAMLGVPPNTLRTWRHRYDLGPTARTAGGHRRYTDEDVERVRRMLVLTASGIAPAAAAAMAAANTPAHEAAVRHVGVSSRRVNVGLRRAANRLDAHLVQDIATTLIAERGVVAAWEHVLLPLLVDLGERFEAGGKGIEVEHVASTAIQQALRDVPFPGRPGRLVALLACAPEEQHSLPLDALGAALSERGQTWLNLGARVPADVLRESIGKLAPAVVVVWAHRADLAERVPVVELADRPDLVVALAGGGWLGVESPDSVLRPATLREALGLVLAAVRVEAH